MSWLSKLYEKITGKCWHKWHYHIKWSGNRICLDIARYPNDPDVAFPAHYRNVLNEKFYKRVCLKCGKCEDTFTEAALIREEVYQQYLANDKVWTNRCKNGQS